MKKLILFIICLLIVQLNFCQTLYPKKQIIQGDTVVVITPNQLKIINGIIQERNGYKTQIVPQYEQLVSEQDSLIQVLNLKVVDWEQINATNQSIISNLSLQNEEVLRQKRRGCWTIGGVCVSIGFITAALIFGLR